MRWDATPEGKRQLAENKLSRAYGYFARVQFWRPPAFRDRRHCGLVWRSWRAKGKSPRGIPARLESQ
jgi:hypothetical protein